MKTSKLVLSVLFITYLATTSVQTVQADDVEDFYKNNIAFIDEMLATPNSCSDLVVANADLQEMDLQLMSEPNEDKEDVGIELMSRAGGGIAACLQDVANAAHECKKLTRNPIKIAECFDKMIKGIRDCSQCLQTDLIKDMWHRCKP